MSTRETNRTAAQERADRIRAFTRELERLGRDGVLVLSDDDRRRVAEHHDETLRDLRERFDVDTTDSDRQVSWGMRIASALGALALAAAVYLFFYRIWGAISTPVQVALLVAAPCLAVAAMEVVRRRERTSYFTGLLGAIAFACFVLDIRVLGTVFNVTPSPKAFLAWSAFALILAYAYGLRLMLAAGIVSAMAYLTLSVGTWSGVYWIYLGQRPENYVLAGAAAFAVPFAVRHRVHDRFPPLYRVLGMLAAFLAILVLANWGRASYLRLDPGAVEILYQSVGFLLSGLAIWVGVRRGFREVVHTGVTFFVLLLYTKFFDWWWDWMPKYLFFLILGLIAVGLLVVLGRARRFLRGVTP